MSVYVCLVRPTSPSSFLNVLYLFVASHFNFFTFNLLLILDRKTHSMNHLWLSREENMKCKQILPKFIKNTHTLATGVYSNPFTNIYLLTLETTLTHDRKHRSHTHEYSNIVASHVLCTSPNSFLPSFSRVSSLV